MQRSSWRRFRRHLPEIATVLLLVLALEWGSAASGHPFWVLPVLVVAGAGIISAAYSRWGEAATPGRIQLRSGLQVGTLGVLSYATGWGPALGVVHLLAVADGIRYSGSRVTLPVLGWAVATIVAGQAAIASGLAPSAVPIPASHAIAGFGALVVVLVGTRIRSVTVAKEEAEMASAASEDRFRSLVQYSSDIVIVIGDARVAYVSPSVEPILGYDVDAVLDLPYLSLVHPDDRQAVVAFVTAMVDTPNATGLIECRLRHADGHWVTVESSCQNRLHDPAVGGFVTISRDISDRKALEDELEHRAFHDALTGLANRALFRDRLEQATARGFRDADLPYGVLYIDLDGFKIVNDTLGHAIGDALLVHVAELLGHCVREVDTAARLGGDEFAVLIDGMRDESGVARVARRFLAELRRPVTIEGHELRISASIGIAIGEPGISSDELLRNADIAMYMAKDAGKATFEIFQPSMHAQVLERLGMEADLQRAVERDEFVLHYQPIVSLDDGSVHGVEALVRWEHPERGTVGPAAFLGLAEETGLIVQIGRWVLQEACRQVAAWQHRFELSRPLALSVNVSLRQLSRSDLVTQVRGALESSGLAPGLLTLELPESALVHDPETTTAALRELKRLGVRLAVDDFGTGYSALTHLQQVPVDVLKIDRSFITGLASGEQDPSLLRAIVDLGHSLHLETVAQGIEHDDELTQFRALECGLGQGYRLARPADGDTIEALLTGGPDLQLRVHSDVCSDSASPRTDR